jgi:hypothetical protein
VTAGYPTLAELRGWLQVPDVVLTDAQLQTVLDAETAAQAIACRVPADPATLPADLHSALLRRCARAVAARGVPLGLSGAEGEEFGPARVPAYDVEIERLEGDRRRFVFG